MTPVALKFLPEAVRANPVALNDLRQETHKSRILSHPNILRIYDLYESPDEAAFISMEYVDGLNLWALRTQQPNGCFTWEYLKPIVRQLCQALDYAHSEGVIHRDLKSANMLIDERHRLRLADFGVAAWAFESPTSEIDRHRGSGTIAYMSPQQIDGMVPCVTDDIYALGATLYELLSGHPPFYQNNIAYQVRNVLATPLLERLADLEVQNDVPPAVAAMIMACLSKNPEQRPQNARAVADWIGLRDSRALPTTSFASPSLIAPPITAPVREPKKTVASAVPTVQVEAPAPPELEENPTGRRLIMVLGSLGLALVAWLAWSYFIPKMPEVHVPLPGTETNPPEANGSNASKTEPAPASTVGATSVGIELGSVNHEAGLRQVTGPDFGLTTATNIEGKECRLLPSRKNARCYFQIATALKRSDPMNARIQVEYYAEASGVLQAKYDGTAQQTPHYTNGGRISFDATDGWKICNYQINDALFRNGEMGGADFCLTTSCPKLYIHSVTVFFDQ
jgi:hypothetical protein